MKGAESRIQPGNVVFVFKIEAEGEITKVDTSDAEPKYYVRIPVDNDIYIYSKEDLHVFPKQAEENIRREWERLSA